LSQQFWPNLQSISRTCATQRQVAGILGYDFFTRFVVDIDYEARVLTLYDPETFVYAGSGTAVPFALKRKTPYVKIRVKVSGHESEEREVLVDSGSGDAVDSDALALSPQKIEVLGGVGLGQEFRTVLSRGEEAQIGPFVLEKPIGAIGGVELIGTEVLRRFDGTGAVRSLTRAATFSAVPR
jgi:hypothetical protein